MKKTAAIIIMAILLSGFHTEVKAGSNGTDGLIFGAGGGALLGQAIGRNTESTLIGTAIGSMLGYVIGNEHDKYGTVQTQTVYRPVVRRVVSPPPRMYYTETRVHPARHQEEVCRDSAVLATINGRPQRIFTTVCLEDGKWVMANDDVRINQTIILADDKHRRAGGRDVMYRQARYNNGRHNRVNNYRNY